jgi:membrane protein involved in colicin uptake
MRMPLLLVAMLISLAGCGPTAEEQRAMDAHRCTGFGNVPGTDAFASCMMSVSQQRDAEEAADRRAASARADADQRAREAQAASDRVAAEKDAETQRNIKQGEDLENEDARKAGFGPSPTDGMNCSTTSSSSGSANNLTTSTSTTCH